MSDEGHGVPENTSCVYTGALSTGNVDDDSLPSCPKVYHSCSPVSIDGSVPRNDIDTCDTSMFEDKLNWPMKPNMDSVDMGTKYSRSTYYYKGNPGVYNLTDSRLEMTGYPIRDCSSMQFCDPAVYFEMSNMVPEDASYRAMEGTCAAMVTMEVEPFVLGQLPSTPKDMSQPVIVPSGETDPCQACEPMIPCYTDACVLRDKVSGNWTGPADECNAGAVFCEACFADSACYGYGPFGSVEEDTETPNRGADGQVIEEEDDADADPDEPTTDTVDDADTSTNEGDVTAATGGDVSNTGFRMQSVGGCLVLFWNAALLLLV